jgi:hypothetical protein
MPDSKFTVGRREYVTHEWNVRTQSYTVHELEVDDDDEEVLGDVFIFPSDLKVQVAEGTDAAIYTLAESFRDELPTLIDFNDEVARFVGEKFPELDDENAEKYIRAFSRYIFDTDG